MEAPLFKHCCYGEPSAGPNLATQPIRVCATGIGLDQRFQSLVSRRGQACRVKAGNNVRAGEAIEEDVRDLYVGIRRYRIAN